MSDRGGEFEQGERGGCIGFRAGGFLGDLLELRVVDEIETYPVFGAEDAAIGDRVFAWGIVGEYGLHVVIEVFDVLAGGEGACDTDGRIDVADDADVALRGLGDDGFEDWERNVEREFDEVVTGVCDFVDGGGGFAGRCHDARVDILSARELRACDPELWPERAARFDFAAQGEVFRGADHEACGGDAVCDHDAEFVGGDGVGGVFVGIEVCVHIGKSGDQELAAAVDVLGVAGGLDFGGGTDGGNSSVSDDDGGARELGFRGHWNDGDVRDGE